MALKSFHQETLNGNWFEERAAPLNGVLPHDGESQFSTTTSVDFVATKSRPPRTKTRLINERSLGEALLQSAGVDISSTFRSSMPHVNKDQETRYLVTTHRAAFGTPLLQPRCVGNQACAGGTGGKRQERGKSTSGAMGEVFRSSREPQRDTASQRSWLYSLDPLIAVKQQSAPGETAWNTSKTQSPPVTESNFRRRTTVITNVAFKHTGVFTADCKLE